MARKALAFLTLIAATPALASTNAAGFEDLDKLEGRLTGALDANVGQPGGPANHIDRRLKLTPCPTPVTIDPPALGAVALRCEQLGWRIRVPIMRLPTAPAQQAAAGGQVIQAGYQPAQPQTPPVIKRGDPVQLVSGSGGFTVSTEATAQEDGRVGGRIRVKPADGKAQIVIGQVVDTGIVRVASF
jgi:flagellar basal body P-ring formation protein FlgA